MGAISVLEEHGYSFHRVAGTSAGAVVGALVAAGIGGSGLQQIMRQVRYPKFEDEGLLDHLGLVGKGASLLLDKGIYEGRYLHDWLASELAKVGVRTFDDIRLDDPGASAPPGQLYKLVAMTSDVSHGRLVRLPWDYHLFGLSAESQTVADAVRLSMSIPFFYEAVQMAGSWFVDGGLLSNFPVDTFDRHDDQPPRWPTFGIKLSARPEANQVEYAVEGVVSLTKAMIGTMLNAHDQMHLDAPGVLARTIFVDTDKVRATDFAIDDATQELLYQNGRSAASRFLQTWDFAKYLQTYRS